MIDFESPVFVSIVLYTIYTLLAIAVALTAWSAVRSWRRRSNNATEHGVAARRIALCTAAGLILIMGASCLAGSTTPLNINGHLYTDSFWLRISDMMIYTTIIMLVIATAVMEVTSFIRK